MSRGIARKPYDRYKSLPLSTDGGRVEIPLQEAESYYFNPSARQISSKISESSDILWSISINELSVWTIVGTGTLGLSACLKLGH
jgi:hypothetical protein